MAASSLALWPAFTFFQTIRHRDYFLPEDATASPQTLAEPPSWLRAAKANRLQTSLNLALVP